MTRWFAALLYALIFACAALPVQACVDTAVQTSETANNADEVMALATPAVDVGEGMLDLPELFFDGRGLAVGADRGIEAPLNLAEAHAPVPFLEGPHRPPRQAA